MMNQVKTILLLGTLMVLLVALGGLISPQASQFFFIASLVINFLMYFFSDKLALMMHQARLLTAEEDPKLHRMMEDLTHRAGLPMPRLYMIPSDLPNAFATGRDPKHSAVAVTAGILQMMPDRELRGVLAHELSHIKNRDTLIATIAAVLASVISQIGSMLRWGMFFGGYQRSSNEEDRGSPFATLLWAMLAPLAATLVQLGISRSREYAADESAARLTNDPAALAYALIRLEGAVHRMPQWNASPATASLFIINPLTGGGVGGFFMNLFSTHPSTKDRVEHLNQLAAELGTSPVILKDGSSFHY